MNRYEVEKDWTENGLRCAVIMTQQGHRCGYVGVDKNHKYYNKDYNDMYDNDLSIDVHGGLTYSGLGGKYPVESNLWWFGYDCAHLYDAPDLSRVDPKVREIMEKFPTDGTIRSLQFCVIECNRLARQLQEI